MMIDSRIDARADPVFQIQRNSQAFALNRRKQSRVHVEIDRIAKLVGFACSCGFDAGGEMRSVVTAERALA